MTKMKRVTVSLTEDLERQMRELKHTGRWAAQPYSELMRTLLWLGAQEARRGREGRRTP